MAVLVCPQGQECASGALEASPSEASAFLELLGMWIMMAVGATMNLRGWK